MKRFLGLLCILFVQFSPFFVYAEMPSPPVAEPIPQLLETHGDKRIDPYFWLGDKSNPKVTAHLNAENSYVEKVMEKQIDLRTKLFGEMKSHIKEDDSTYPYKIQNYLYFYKNEKNKEYPSIFRKPANKDNASEEVLLDVNELAKGHDYTQVRSFDVSENGNILAYALDTKGDRVNTIYFKNLSTGKYLSDKIEGVSSGPLWAADNKTIFYIKNEPKTLRSRWVYRHELGASEDVLVYDEKDDKFDLDIYRGLGRQYIFISSHSKTTREVQFVSTSEPSAKFRLIQPRQKEVEYYVSEGGDRFLIRTNWQAVNFRIMETPFDKPEMANWKEVIPHRSDEFIDHFTVFKSKIVLETRKDGLPHIQIYDRVSQISKYIPFKDEDYLAYVDRNYEYDASFVRFSYQSMTTPFSTIDYDFKTGIQTVRKQQEVPGGFDSKNYLSKRIWATNPADKTRIPISLVYRKKTKFSRNAPLLLYGYGSYGYSMESYFNSTILSLLDRGFIYAVAHVRGGSEMGRPWYLDGKLLNKKNTFNDFIACADHLIKNHYTSSPHLYAKGESAGGLLMGAVMNLRPKLFHGVIADVPFVDVLTTMLDASLPLTTGEYEEWGNPNDKQFYDYIKSYSPYDNVKKTEYPNILVRAGFNDTQVGYWEPAKWVAKLRKNQSKSNLILMKTEMGAGHSGKNGRYSQLENLALEYAFLLRQENGKN